jgi:hypothetical protein
VTEDIRFAATLFGSRIQKCASRVAFKWCRRLLMMTSLALRRGARSRLPPYFEAGASTRRPLTSSSVEGPTKRPLDLRTLTGFFREEILEKHAHFPALICRQERPRVHGGPPSPNLGVTSHLAWDFNEFDRHIRALARGLVALDVRKGDRVAVLMGNNRCVLC